MVGMIAGSFGMVLLVVFALGVAILAVFVYMLRSLFTRQDTGAMAEEARIVQDMYRTLNRLEERVVVLEDLLHQQRSSRSHHE